MNNVQYTYQPFKSCIKLISVEFNLCEIKTIFRIYVYVFIIILMKYHCMGYGKLIYLIQNMLKKNKKKRNSLAYNLDCKFIK